MLPGSCVYNTLIKLILFKVTSEHRDAYMVPDKRHECNNCVQKSEVKPLSENYSTKIGLPVENEQKPDIKVVLFGDKFQQMVPTLDSDHHRNYLKPNPEDYRKKRTVVYVPKYDEPSISKNTTTEYADTYVPQEIKREKIVYRK
jgi:hypothetical protein